MRALLLRIPPAYGERAPSRAAAAATRRRHIAAQRLAHAQRHDAVAGAGALSGVSRAVFADLLPDRDHHLDLPDHRLVAATADRPALDRRPDRDLPVAMGFTLFGLALLGFANCYPMLLVSVALIGVGSAVFHPEASRVARAASGGRHGFAQSLFQVGGNFGQSLGPLMAAFIVVPSASIRCSPSPCSPLSRSCCWPASPLARGAPGAREAKRRPAPARPSAPRSSFAPSRPGRAAVLEDLLSRQHQQLLHVLPDPDVPRLGADLAGAAVRVPRRRGGGHVHRRPVGDRFGAKFVIWVSILGVLPFTLLLPHLGLVGTMIDSIAIGLVLSSAFSAMVVYAQELAPGNVGAVAGLFFGLSFGLGGLGAAALGLLADQTSLTFVYMSAPSCRRSAC